jgi:hypothetical protein
MKNADPGPAASARQIETRNVGSLGVHAALLGLPMCTEEQFAALCRSINLHGLKKPLTVIGDQVIDGRNRLEAVKSCGLKQCEVVEAAPGTDPLAYAIESAVTGRNLTKSGIVLFLFLKHPALHDLLSRKNARKSPKGGSVISITHPPEKGSESFAALAENYRVPREYFSTLATLHDEATDEEWAEIERAILACEASIPALKAGFAGGRATLGKKRSDPKYHLLAPKIAVTLCSAFKAWGKINWAEHAKLHDRACYGLQTAFAAMPDEVREINKRAIEQWPEHERRALAKDLNRRLRGARTK